MWSKVRMPKTRSKNTNMDLKMNMELSMEHPNIASQKRGSKKKNT